MNSSEERYALLRSWYLAHLRKGALAEQQKLQMTPGALIAADKDTVMKLAAGKSLLTDGNGAQVPTVRHCPFFFFAWLVAMLSGWLLLLINSGMDVPVSLNHFQALTLGIFTQNSSPLPVSPLYFLVTIAFYGLPGVGIAVAFAGRKRN